METIIPLLNDNTMEHHATPSSLQNIVSRKIVMKHPPPMPYGHVLDERYQIHHILGRGGFATVYEGNDLRLNQPVAIKILHDTIESTQLERFAREVDLAVKIEHPDVVSIYDKNLSHPSTPYLIMERLNGYTLKEALWRHGAMAQDRALRLFRQCLHALNAAHMAGIVHRDLKPSNLMLVQPQSIAERLCIMDFGLAYCFDGAQDRLTESHVFVGTPEYMAPEYIDEQTISPALDVYQMALIFVEMLTGSPLIQGDMIACYEHHRQGCWSLPPHIEAMPWAHVIKKALHIDHNNRYVSAQEFLEALEQYPQEPSISSEPFQPTQHTSTHEPPKPAHRTLWITLGLSIALIVGLVLALSLKNTQPKKTNVAHTILKSPKPTQPRPKQAPPKIVQPAQKTQIKEAPTQPKTIQPKKPNKPNVRKKTRQSSPPETKTKKPVQDPLQKELQWLKNSE